jgi:uncharacterized protein YegL
MGFRKSEKTATASTTQVVTFIVDDSGSMKGMKAAQVTEQMKNAVTTMQSNNQGSSGSRFLLNICKFGDSPAGLAEAARPGNVNVDNLTFQGESGRTDMPRALQWARQAVEKALSECRANPTYNESETPNPLCVFLSDGENTGSDVAVPAAALRSVPFHGGSVDVVAVGVGMQDAHFEVMKQIASQPQYALRIDDDDIANFLATVGATVVEGRPLQEMIERFS